MSTVRTFELINKRQSKSALDRELYISEDVFQHDLEYIWYKEWIFAGHAFEISKPGEYITLQIGQYPVIIVRGEKGEIRAFHNVCRHRGSRLCQNAKGKNAKLVCPYHKWTFSLDGKLLYAGSMGEDFDKADNGLFPIHCETVCSFIFICLADLAPDFEQFRNDIAPFIFPHYLDNCKVAFESNLIEKGNWKLVFENNRECFHCDGNHPELMNSFVDNLSVAGVGGAEDPDLTAHWDKCEQAGLPSRLVMDEEGQYRMTRIPLSGSSRSYTMSGNPAVQARLDDTDVENIGVLLYFLYPSTWNHFLGDHALTFRVLPLSSGETLVTTKWLVPEVAVEGIDYDVDNLTKVWLATNYQDRQLVEETFWGIQSPAYIPGQFSDVAENGVCQFVDWYCSAMKKQLSQAE